MSDLFSAAGLEGQVARPLADRLRPETLSDFVGQDQLIGPDGPIGAMLASRRLASMILWGPSGVGKTTLARLLARQTELAFEPLSAIFSGVKELRAVFERAEGRRIAGKGTLLFVDEIHRFNRAQQDSFLPFVEAGVVTLVGATTENPSFALNTALMSRCQVMVLERLSPESLEILLTRAEADAGQTLPLDEDARSALLRMSDGDGRYLLNLAEQLFQSVRQDVVLTSRQLQTLLRKRAPDYDRSGDQHYNLISALHKSVRASDADAALYWLARMLQAGEDPLFVARRLIRMASEDVGLADPTALMIAGEAARTYERIGSPEGDLALAHAVIHLATAPKSNAAYRAWEEAKAVASETGSLMPQLHSLNAPTLMMKEKGYGGGYLYDHDMDEGFSAQDHFPQGMTRREFYRPAGIGRERAISEQLKRFSELRRRRGNPK